MKFDQSDRLIRLTGPFGAEEVCAESFAGTESISRLFSYRLDFLSLNLELVGKDIIGKNMTVEVRRFDEKSGEVKSTRYFNGYINRLSAGRVSTHQDVVYRSYHVEIVPWLWFLSQRSNCHIFFPDKETKSIKEVIEDVFARSMHVSPHFQMSASSLSEHMVEHCVQYRESDFNFVSRLLEQYGAYYYFKHEDGKHTMMISDQASYPSCEEAVVDFPKPQQGRFSPNCVSSWEHQFQFVSGEFTHTDYNIGSNLAGDFL